MFYWLASKGAEPFGGNRDIPVLLIVGVLFGWFVLFLLDGTKRIQAAIVLSIGSVSVGTQLLESGRIIGAIGRSPASFVIGVAIGVITGGISARLFGVKRPESMGLIESLAWVQFEGATEAFRHGITSIVILAAIDYSLINPLRETVGYSFASVILLLSLSVFVQYQYEKSVVAIAAPDPNNSRKYLPYVFGGLFDRARRRYHGFTIRGGAILNQAMSAASLNTLVDRFDRKVAFGFASGIQAGQSGIQQLGSKLLPRTARIESEGITTERLPSLNSSREDSRVYLYSRLVVRGIARHLILLVPDAIRKFLPNRSFTKIDKLDRSDVVLLIGPTLADEPMPDGSAVFDTICARYKHDPTTEVILVTTEAPAGSVQNHDTKVNSMENLGIERNHLSWTNVYPLSRFKNEIAEDGDEDEFRLLLNRLSE